MKAWNEHWILDALFCAVAIVALGSLLALASGTSL